jgi:cytochrome c oxidase subunit 2
MKRQLLSALAMVVMALMVRAARADNAFDYCLLCHGANANGNYAIRAPKLSGMEPWYLARQLENFASGTRGSPVDDASGHEMRPVGLRLRESGELEAAVKFIGTLKPERPAPTITGNVAQGRRHFAACAACHGARGEGNAELQSPALAARSDWYLVTQLVNYKSGLRGSDERDTHGAQMRAVVNALPDEQAIRDVVAYINTLK